MLFSTAVSEVKWRLQMRLLLNKGNEKNQSYIKYPTSSRVLLMVYRKRMDECVDSLIPKSNSFCKKSDVGESLTGENSGVVNTTALCSLAHDWSYTPASSMWQHTD